MESKQEWAEGIQMKELNKQGLLEKPRSPKSKGYGNLGRGSPKYLAKAHENEELECARDAQGNEIG